MKSVAVRETFIDFFKEKTHQFVRPSSVVPNNDPTLLFTNAGMNQFKRIFLGVDTPAHVRAVNAQPCIRVSGKHNDLEDVGRDTFHHTCFEMLGNWSFGDYYKKEAIRWAWELLTEAYGFNKQQLVATVFDDDDESAEYWRSETDILPNHIVRCGAADNFWEMGSVGPCGPCSEIHLDLSPESGGNPIQDPKTRGLTRRYMELWNLVFIQYNRSKDGELTPLPQCHVDTGAGLERLAAQLQGVGSNYAIDSFQHIIQGVESLVGVPYDDGQDAVFHRVISDHIRTICFALADQVIPSNEGRGYVIRRLIRRALRFASQAGIKKSFLYHLVPYVDESFDGHYPLIGQQNDRISGLIQSEEEQFLKTVESGLTLFHRVMIDLKSTNQTVIDGDTAFKLYDTYGFPLDLTQVLAEENNVTVDEDGFNHALDMQRKRSRASHSQASDIVTDGVVNSDRIEFVHHGIYTTQPGGGERWIPINKAQRFGLAQHHSGTHLLHAALRQVIGEHVNQAGSLVDINRLRFDFTHNTAISSDELAKLSMLVNHWIAAGVIITTSEQSLERAKEMGAIAMFGETYDDVVRVVKIGDITLDICGGNHVMNTNHLEVITIVSEGSVASGIRRIEAVVGTQRSQDVELNKRFNVIAKIQKQQSQLMQLNANHDYIKQLAGLSLDAVPIKELELWIHTLNAGIKDAKKQQLMSEKLALKSLVGELSPHAQPLRNADGVALFACLDNQTIPMLKDMSDQMIQAIGPALIVLVSGLNQSTQAVIKVSNELTQTINAVNMMHELTALTGGRGGGRSNLSQAGGLDATKVDDALNQLRSRYCMSQ